MLKTVKLGEIVTIIGGGTPSKKQPSYWDNGTIKWATVGDMNVEIINKTQLCITEKGLKESSSNIISNEAIVIATRVGLGKVCCLESATAINQDLKGLLPNIKKTNKNYLFYFLKSISEYIIEKGTGATVKGVKLDFIKNIDIPLPPLQEQQRIVSKLDLLFLKIDKSITLHVKNMDEADAFMGSVLNDVFGELEEKYGKELWNDVLTIKNGKHYKDVVDEYGKYPIYGSGGIMKYANDYLCNENSVIIGRKGTINSPLFVKEKFWNIDTAFGIESKIDKLVPMFLFYFTKKFNFLDLNKSTTLPSLAKTHLLQIEMVIPPLPIQQKTVTYLDQISQKIEKIKQVQKEKMASLKALKASILDQAFRGEL